MSAHHSTYEIDEMSEAEDLMYQYLMNERDLYDWIRNTRHESYNHVEKTMCTIIRCHARRNIPAPFSQEDVRHILIFVHMMDSMDLIAGLDHTIINKYINIDSENCVPKPKPGDMVIHKKMPELTGTILAEDINDPDKWCVLYLTGSKRKQGFWCKKYTLPFNKPKQTSHITDPVGNNLKILAKEIPEHLRNAADSFEKVAQQLPPVTYKLKPEHIMKAEIIHRTEINGKDIDYMAASDILNAIGNTKEGINKLKNMTKTSAFARQETKRLQNFIKEATNLLDKKFATADE